MRAKNKAEERAVELLKNSIYSKPVDKISRDLSNRQNLHMPKDIEAEKQCEEKKTSLTVRYNTLKD
jgi:hypothetical protein